MTGFASVVVLTALGLERKAVLAHLEDVREEQHETGTIYDVGRLAGHPDVRVAVAEVGAGNVGTGIHVERAVRRYGPELLMFIGVAGGIKDVAQGDVVVASKMYGYESGKAADTFVARPVVYPLTHRIEQRVRRVIGEGTWRRRCEGREAGGPNAYLGPIATGDALIRSTTSELFHRLRTSYDDTLAVEMEGRGLFEGAHLNESLPAVVVRGISDLIDDKTADNDARWQPVAAANAAAFGMQLLEGLQQVRSPLEEGSNEVLRGVADWLRQSYYVNLLALLRDPTARPFLTDEVMGWLENARSWNDFNLANGIRMLDVAARVCKGWEAPAVAIDNAIDRDLLGARVVFDGRFRTRNLRHFDAERGLSGDLERDPVLYTDIAGTRVFLPIDPKWITTTTGSHVFGGGQLRASGVGTLRTLEDGHALVSPMVIGPWAEAERMTAMVFGGSGSR